MRASHRKTAAASLHTNPPRTVKMAATKSAGMRRLGCRNNIAYRRGLRMSNSLLATRRFAPLFWCQFFSAFNDNFLKNALAFLILYKWAVPNSETLIALATAIFIFPFFILSAIGGEVADRYDKSGRAQRLKLVEIAVAGIAVAGFWFDSPELLFAALFLVGVIAALFGPIKYGILPDHLAESELPAGNALVEGATFIAILAGTIVAGFTSKDGSPASFA